MKVFNMKKNISFIDDILILNALTIFKSFRKSNISRKNISYLKNI